MTQSSPVKRNAVYSLADLNIARHAYAPALVLTPSAKTPDFNQLVSFLDVLLTQKLDIRHLQLPKACWHHLDAWHELMVLTGAESFSRQSFYQLDRLWLQYGPSQTVGDENKEICCPARPPRPLGEVYRRFDPVLGKNISFRVADMDSDLSRFHRWMNDERVAYFWEQAWSEEKLADYLNRQLNNANSFPLIGCFDDQPFGYFEVYWAAQDRIAPFYPWQAFDRGIHLLVGENEFRGQAHFTSWLRALSHYIYLDEPRTEQIVLEPRVDNRRLFNHIGKLGYQIKHEFDFPHKRAALVMGARENFFQEHI